MGNITIFTDGSSRGNPGPGGWGAIVVYPDSKEVLKVDELGGRAELTTNNRMELLSAISALKHFDGYYQCFDEYNFAVFSDSEYVIKGITLWIEGWQKKNWKNSQRKDVLNRDLWEQLLEVTQNKKITWKYVRGHTGHEGNERCDVIATSFADNEPIDLYKGSLAQYRLKLIL